MIPNGTGAWFCPKIRLLPGSDAHEPEQNPVLLQGPFPSDTLRIQPPVPEVLPCCRRNRSGRDGLSASHAEGVLSTLFQLSRVPGCCLQSKESSSLQAKLQGLCPADKSLQSTGFIAN